MGTNSEQRYDKRDGQRKKEKKEKHNQKKRKMHGKMRTIFLIRKMYKENENKVKTKIRKKEMDRESETN